MNNLITLDYQSRTPLYEQIVNKFEKYIALNILKPNEQIPSIRDLALELGLNPNTIRKAYEKLEQKGIIKTISTKGTFVSSESNIAIENKINENILQIKEIINELELLGLKKEEIFKRLK